MAAFCSSHGGAVRLSLLVVLLLGAGATALRPQVVRRKGHTLDDLVVSTITPADVEHIDTMRFIREAVADMQEQGITLSEECEHRYGQSFITDQKAHHFRLCQSSAKLNPNGVLLGVKRGPSALTQLRARLEKKQQIRQERLAKAANRTSSAGAAAAGSSNGTAAVKSTTGATGRRLRDQQRPQAQPWSLPAHIATATDPEEDLDLEELLLEELLEAQAERPGQPLLPDAAADVAAGLLGQGSSRRLQVVAASGKAGSSLIYKLLKQVSANKNSSNGAMSELSNGDGGRGDADDEDAKDAAEELEDGAGGGIDRSTADEAAEKQRKREAWLAKHSVPLSEIVEPDTELPELTAINTTYKSSVGCYLQPTLPRNAGYKDAQVFCLGRNVVLDTCAFFDGQNEDYLVRFPKPKVGAVKLGCNVHSSYLTNLNLTKGYKNRMWWLSAQDAAYDTVRQSCSPSSGRVVEHPVAFILRDRYTHTLHELEVLSTIFTSLAVVDLPEIHEQGVQIVIADQMPHASYRPTYAAISYPYRLRHLAEAPYPPNTCFRTALFINAFTNSIAFNPNPNTSQCYSPVMVGVHKWLRFLHRELDPAYLARVHHHASETSGIVRRSVVWTSRRNLEALRLTTGVGMTAWQSARMVPNENEVVAALQATILQWNSRSCLLARYYEGDEGMEGCRNSSLQYDLVFGEFSDWPYYPDQLMTIYRSGILIGVHGAALTFVVSTNVGESALLELAGVGWEETQTGNMLNLFPSLAHNMGAYYEQVRYQGPDIDIKVATDALVRAMDEVSRRIMEKEHRLAQDVDPPHFNDQYNFDIMFPQTCPTSVPNKLRRYVTNHPVQMTLNETDVVNGTNATAGATAGDTANGKDGGKFNGA